MYKKLEKLLFKAILGLILSQRKAILNHLLHILQYKIKNIIPFESKPQKRSWKRMVFWTIISGLIAAISEILISKTSHLAHSN
ncbi:MAG: hypothetical protein GX640_05750 [Fibrobacter sp.]|nr:hypothetical protein [Fibrobacter sp.]